MKQKIVAWIKARPLLKISELERQCNIPQGALNKAINGNYTYLSDKHLPALAGALKPYGYK